MHVFSNVVPRYSAKPESRVFGANALLNWRNWSLSRVSVEESRFVLTYMLTVGDAESHIYDVHHQGRIQRERLGRSPS